MTLNWAATSPTIRKEAKGVVLIIRFTSRLTRPTEPAANIPMIALSIFQYISVSFRWYEYTILYSTSRLHSSVQVGAIAAGNAVVLKPSEISASVGALFAELVPKYLDPKLVRVVTGGIPESTKVSTVVEIHTIPLIDDDSVVTGVEMGP